MLKIKLLTFFLVMMSVMAWSQSYNRLIDPSGLDTDEYQQDLIAAADSLISVFPAEFQSQFKVYDFGFYLHQEQFEGGFPEVFSDKVAEIATQSPYYLIFGKQTDQNGLYSKIWVDLKLPMAANLPCFTAEVLTNVKTLVENTLLSNYTSGNYTQYSAGEIAAINILKKKVNKLINCCEDAFVPDCTFCDKVTSEDLVITLRNEGFLEFMHHNITVTPETYTESYIDSEYRIVAENNLFSDVYGVLDDVIDDEIRDVALNPGYTPHISVRLLNEGNCDVEPGPTSARFNTGFLLEFVIVQFEGEPNRLLVRLSDPNFIPSINFRTNNAVIVPVLVWKTVKMAAKAAGKILIDYGIASSIEMWFNDDINAWDDAINKVISDLGWFGNIVNIYAILSDSRALDIATVMIQYVNTSTLSDFSIYKMIKAGATTALMGYFLDARHLSRIRALIPNSVTRLAIDIANNPRILFVFLRNRNGFKAWKALIDFPNLSVKVDRLEDVSRFLTKNPGTENAIKQGLNDVGEHTDAFLNGIKNATEDLSHLGGRSALPDEIADGVNRIKQHRVNIDSPNGGNYGHIDGTVNGIAVDNKMWRSGEADIQVEPQIFDAIEVAGSSGNSWLRNTDSEYKMLNQLADDLGGVSGNVYPNVTGLLKIVSENPYCLSCQGVIQQFHSMFPNLNLILVDGVR